MYLHVSLSFKMVKLVKVFDNKVASQRSNFLVLMMTTYDIKRYIVNLYYANIAQTDKDAQDDSSS